MTVRDALLPTAAVLVLGMGVYLLVEVRAQSAPPTPVPHQRTSQARAAVPEAPQAAAPAPQAAAPAPQAATAGRWQPLSRMSLPRPADSPASPPSRDAAGSQSDGELVGPKLDAAMTEANTAYDRGDFEDAKQLANRVLTRYPTNARMLRIMVSASCIDGDSAVAQTHYAKLPPADQEQMKIRCARYGTMFADKP